ncbi:phenoloxidase-activating factor 3 [Atheta coriaria]|uniref:phenoloxidase-activating factor 3 n=1 Tax=Dalotia coriaria TaxID=877792 RepID=UPI0031F3B1B0
MELVKITNLFINFIVLSAMIKSYARAEGTVLRRTSRASNFCSNNMVCVPISSCPVLRDIIKNECVINNRVSSLGCGYQGSGLVCCPQTSQATSFKDHKTSDGHVCGQTAVQGENYEGVGTYPWIARIGFKNTQSGEVKYPCTGSILNRRVILTAAHCALAKSTNFKLYNVRIGEYTTNSDIDCGEEFCGLPNQDIQISHVIIHPNYEKQSYKNNIALIVLRSAMNFSVTSQPICLPESWSVTSSNGILVGWGKTAGQTVTIYKQQVLHLPITNLRKCANVYGNTLPITDNHLCAGGELGHDACSGFGGAPLMIQQGDTYYQIGILSFGSDQCGAQGIPSVYTNVRKYVNWIKENIPVIYNN